MGVTIYHPVDRVSRVQAQIAGVAVGNTGAEPEIQTPIGQLPEWYLFYPEPVEAAAEA